MLIVFAVICFILAVAIGSWRQMCGVYELKMPHNNPPIWRNPFVRIFTWIISTSLSIIFATILAMWISVEVNDWLGKFSFGVLLLIRWVTSLFFGAYPAYKRCEEFQKTYGKGSKFDDEFNEEMIKARNQNNEP
jgi:hypothetical protein